MVSISLRGGRNARCSSLRCGGFDSPASCWFSTSCRFLDLRYCSTLWFYGHHCHGRDGGLFLKVLLYEFEDESVWKGLHGQKISQSCHVSDELKVQTALGTCSTSYCSRDVEKKGLVFEWKRL